MENRKKKWKAERQAPEKKNDGTTNDKVKI